MFVSTTCANVSSGESLPARIPVSIFRRKESRNVISSQTSPVFFSEGRHSLILRLTNTFFWTSSKRFQSLTLNGSFMHCLFTQLEPGCGPAGTLRRHPPEVAFISSEYLLFTGCQCQQ